MKSAEENGGETDLPSTRGITLVMVIFSSTLSIIPEISFILNARMRRNSTWVPRMDRIAREKQKYAKTIEEDHVEGM